MAIRVLHYSDVHVDVPLGQLPWRSMWNKRLLGAANLYLRRRARFAHAREKLAALAELAAAEEIDLVVSTGDFTALGTHPELQAAREAIDGLTAAPMGMCAVPGNHDVYLPDAILDRRFQRYFGEFMLTDMPELQTDGVFPYVRLFGTELAVVGVNSARPNPQLWRSSGRTPQAQIEGLHAVLSDPRVAGRFVLLLTHYAPRRPDGSHDSYTHGLENADELLGACGAMVRGALLHGHIHHRMHVRAMGVPIFGAGSTTDAGREGLWVFEVEPGQTRVIPGHFRDGRYALEPESAVHL